MKAFRILLWLAWMLAANAWADAYPTSRRGGLSGNVWTNIGVDGGHRRLVTTVYTNISDTSITLSALNTVINVNCPSNQAVVLASGTYNNLAGVIQVKKNGVVLRGTTNSFGGRLTILKNVGFSHGNTWYPSGTEGGWPSITTRTITAGLSEGSTSITVSSPPNADFAPGDIMMIDQTSDGTTVVNDTVADYFTRDTRPYVYCVQILTTNATTITFQPALLGTYWDTATRSPVAVGWSSSVGHSPQYVGIEDLDLPDGSAQEIYGMRLGPAYGSWVYNVRGLTCTDGAIRFSFGVNCSVSHSDFHDSTGNGSGSYGCVWGPMTQSRFEDNISTNSALFVPIHSSVGDSISFNYSSGPFPYSPSGWLAEHIFPHGGHSHHTIFEGNYTVNIYFDDVYSNNNSDCGIVRNRLVGNYTGKTQDRIAYALGEFDGGTGNHRNMTVIGNCLGDDSLHTSYANIYSVEAVVTGLIKTNNYNVGDDAIPVAETMSGDTMLDSYVYSSRPDWFGFLAFPAYGPAVSYVNANSYTNIPAGWRSLYGSNPPPAQAQGGGGSGQNWKKASQSAFTGRRR